MKTELFTELTDENVERAAKIIKDGGLLGIPTETVYGLGADALNERAVLNIFLA
jgi:L-threonylcarbamoyladenylate synthase